VIMTEEQYFTGSAVKSAFPADLLGMTFTSPQAKTEVLEIPAWDHFPTGGVKTDHPFAVQSKNAISTPTDRGRWSFLRSIGSIAVVGSQLVGPAYAQPPGVFRLNVAPSSSYFENSTIEAGVDAAALKFFNGLELEAKSQTLKDIILMSYELGAPSPIIEVLDGIVTADFSSNDRLLSVMIDGDVCNVSAFSRHKELKMSYFTEAGQLRDELNDFIWLQLRDFARESRET